MVKADLRAAADKLVASGLGGVVLSRAHDPALVVTGGTVATVTTPPITTVDPCTPGQICSPSADTSA